MSVSKVRTAGSEFRDEAGRQVILRGVNLGGDCKVPYPDGGTQHPSDFSDHREISFIGRPFPLAEADEHFARLTHWGFDVVRLLTTWEAVEHGGRGVYDEAYLDYLAAICAKAGEHGLHLFIDFHQDVWSRMSGGDGAPGWCFEAVGLDFAKFDAADAAHVMQRKFDYTDPSGRQAAYPQMSWGSNYRLPANGIMWSLFWCGRDLTPDFLIEGENVQEVLQGAYLGAMGQVAARISHLPNVLGFDTLNEPGVGYIGEPLSYRHMGPSDHNSAHARVGVCLSPLDALTIARGLPTSAPVLGRDPAGPGMIVIGDKTLNANGLSIWRDGAVCPFEQAGAYRVVNGAVQSLREDFFAASAAGVPLDIVKSGYGPFFHKVAATIRAHNPDWAVFAELDPFGVSAGRKFPADLPANTINGTHWYDRATLFGKSFNATNHVDLITGRRETCPDAIRDRFVRELGRCRAYADEFSGGAPSLIGEFGIPYDLDDGASFGRWDAGERGEDLWTHHTEALSLMYDAMDALQLHSTQWNYTASNRNDLRIGDNWNQEDLSIFSRDQQEHPGDPDSGGRALLGFCRPYAQAVQGRLTRMAFDRHTGRFEIEFDADPTITEPTLIYLPKVQFPNGCTTTFTGAQHRVLADPNDQRVALEAVVAGRTKVIFQAVR